MNEEKKKVLPCIALCEGDIHPRALTCGDPARAKKIADKLDNAVCLAPVSYTHLRAHET